MLRLSSYDISVLSSSLMFSPAALRPPGRSTHAPPGPGSMRKSLWVGDGFPWRTHGFVHWKTPNDGHVFHSCCFFSRILMGETIVGRNGMGMAIQLLVGAVVSLEKGTEGMNRVCLTHWSRNHAHELACLQNDRVIVSTDIHQHSHSQFKHQKIITGGFIIGHFGAPCLCEK